MDYHIYAHGTEKEGKAVISFSVYNLRNEKVYQICRTEEEMSGGILPECTDKDGYCVRLACERALYYFSNFIRHRYYDEHFATILDEDYVTVTSVTDLFAGAETAVYPGLMSELEKYRDRGTITFTPEPTPGTELRERIEAVNRL